MISIKKTLRQKDESSLIEGMYNNNKRLQFELYEYCSRYFWANYKGVFIIDSDTAEEIFSNSFIKLWENIENRKIYTENGIIYGHDKKPLTSNILSYFMGIAKIKYLEWVRTRHATNKTDLNPDKSNKLFDVQEYIHVLYDYNDNVMYDIISDIISGMSIRCKEILTKFYYECKNLDVILTEIPSIESKDTLKSKKYKCIETLRKSANEIYYHYLNT